MADFINTIDVIGDDVLARSIVDGSVVEFCDDAVTSIGDYAFYNCSKLTTANFPAVTSINGAAFMDCSKLTTADFSAVTSIGNQAFLGTRALAILIIRNTAKVATLKNTTMFDNSPIKTGNGYIYVPAALVGSYKSATNWSAHASKFRALEDYTVDGTVTGELDPTKI